MSSFIKLKSAESLWSIYCFLCYHYIASCFVDIKMNSGFDPFT